MARGQELNSVLVMARRRKPDPMELQDQHSRCPWTQLREQDQLLQRHPPQVVARQRRRCREWLAGELTWSEVLGER